MTDNKKEKIDTQELEKLKAEAEEKNQLQDKYLRLVAEVENFKKRVQKEKELFIEFSRIDLFVQLLPIIDDFDRAREAAKEHKHGAVFSEGLEMILDQLHKLLENNEVTKIKTVGEKFDPHIHEAIAAVESDEQPEGMVIEEVYPGYTLGEKLIRAAKVKITKEKEKQEGKKDE